MVEHDFYLSYATEDTTWALTIADFALSQGYRVYVGSRGRADEAAAALSESAVMLAVLSPAYLGSLQTTREWELSVNSGRPVLPVQVRAGYPPTGAALPSVDLTDGEPAEIEVLESELASALRSALRRPAAGRPKQPGSDPVTCQIVYARPDQDVAQAIAAELDGYRASGYSVLTTLRSFRGWRTVHPATAAGSSEVTLVLLSRDLLGQRGDGEWLSELFEVGGARVLPVNVRPVARSSPFEGLAALPRGGRPISEWESRDAAIASVVDGVRLAIRELPPRTTGDPPEPDVVDLPEPDVVHPPATRGGDSSPGTNRATEGLDRAYQPDGGPRVQPGAGRIPGPPRELPEQRSRHRLEEVFTRSGLPTITFVEPPDFFRLVIALRTPGRGIVIEGPSGIGKTTLLRKALTKIGADGPPARFLSARRPADLPVIESLPDGHEGLVAVDDFHRLPIATRARLLDYLKVLADTDAEARLVVVGIPGTGASLIRLGFDVATRIDVFRLPRVDDELVLRVVGLGGEALNVAFEGPSRIVRAAAGSLLTAQMLCWELAVLAGIDATQPYATPVTADVGLATEQVLRSCAPKYDPELAVFAGLGAPGDVTAVRLLVELAERDDGLLPLDELRAKRPELAAGIEAFVAAYPDGLRDAAAAIENHLHYDPRARLLVGEDPQLLFYLRRLSPERIAALAGKRLPRVRDQVFVSYSHQDRRWLDRLDVHLRPLVRDDELDLWADTRIAAGDRWLDEITAALERARAAILLVSADFLASDFIARAEIPPLLAAAERGGCRIIPVIVGPSLFADNSALSAFQAVNPPDRPLAALRPHEADDYLVKVARALRTPAAL